MTLTSQPAPRRSIATALPTRPHPITSTFTRASVAQPALPGSDDTELLVHHLLREGDDQHLARRLPEDEVDRRREETGLPPPARRGPEDDQVDAALAGVVDD